MKKSLIIFILLVTIKSYAICQTYCQYYVPDYKYQGNNGPDLKIELKVENGENVFIITSTKKDEPFKLPNCSIQFFLMNESKVSINVSSCTLKYITDGKGRSIPTYTYKPSTVETIQFQAGIMGIIYIEPFPGDVIGYTLIGGC